jgi:FlgD Ig-like domain
MNRTSRLLRGWWVTIMLIPAAASAQALLPQIPIATYQGGSGNVQAITKSGNTVYVGGTFDYIGPLTGSVGLADATTGAITPGFPMSDGSVSAAAADGSGGWYVNGSFTTIGGKSRAGLAHILSNLTVDDAWLPPARSGDEVFGPIIASGGRVYVAGGGGQALSRMLRVYDATNGAELFNVTGYRAYSMLLNGSTLYIGGNFGGVGGQARANLAALDASTGAVLPWTCNTNGVVYALALDGSTLYVGGQFTALGGFARSYLGSTNASTGATSLWMPNPNSGVYAMVVNGTRLYVAGAFTMSAGVARTDLTSFDTATGTQTSWNPSVGDNGAVYSLAVSGGTVYFGGYFTNAGGQKRLRAAAVDATTGVPTAWRAQASDQVQFVATSGSSVLLAGNFQSIGGEARTHLASFDATTGAISSWDPDPNGVIYAIAFDATNVYVAGDFNTIGGQSRLRMAALSPTTGLATSWNPAPDGQPFALVPSGSIVYVAGNFVTIGGASRAYIAALNVSNGLATSWNPSANGQVSRLLLSGGLVYVGGWFTSIGGQSRTGLAALSPSTGLANGWNPGAANIYGMSANGTTLYVFGDFQSAGVGAPLRSGMAGIDMNTGVANAFDPHPFYSQAIHPQGDIIYANGKVYAQGSGPGGPMSIGGQSRYLAELDPSTSQATTFNPYLGGFFYWYSAPFLLDGTILYAGGQTALRTGAGPVRRNLNAWDLSILVAVGDPPPSKGLALSLGPNPSAGATRIHLELPHASRVRVAVFDLQGREVVRLADGTMAAGARDFTWDGVSGSGRRESGVYFVSADVAGERVTRRLVVLR